MYIHVCLYTYVFSVKKEIRRGNDDKGKIVI